MKYSKETIIWKYKTGKMSRGSACIHLMDIGFSYCEAEQTINEIQIPTNGRKKKKPAHHHV